jgi:protocatechuate 3,4-dioxygenase beta subunit
MKRCLPLGLVLFCVPAWAQNPASLHIVDAQKVPVAGASVEARLYLDRKWVSRPGQTDQNGDVSLDLPLAPGPKNLVGVWVVAKGYAFSKAELNGAKTELALEKGVVWRGKVVDEAGKPLPGASVSLIGSQVGNDWKSSVFLFGTKFAEDYVAQSGADGSFEINDVPPTGLLYRVSKPGFAGARGQDAKASAPLTVSLVEGGIVQGKLLGVDGASLPKMRVSMQPLNNGNMDGYGEALTGDDGTFVIDTLATGNYNLMVILPDDANYIVAAQENLHAQKGETVNVPDLRAVEGVVVEGIVRDAATGQGVPGAMIGLHGPHRPASSAAVTSSQPTGADGKFSIRVVPGPNHFYFYGSPEGYSTTQSSKDLNISKMPPEPLIFDIERNVPLHGITVDEAGKPIQAILQTNTGRRIESGKDGKWQYTMQDERSWARSLEFVGGDTEDGYFEVVSPRSVELSDTREIKVTLHKKGWLVLPGRAVGTDGKPLQGVQVELTYFAKNGEYQSFFTVQRSATSDADGFFDLPKIRPTGDSELVEIKGTKPGFIFRKGGSFSKNGPVWQLSDLVFVPLNRKIEGITTAGAKVVAAGQEVIAGADGKFVFEGLPADESLVFAAKDESLGSASAAPYAIELKKAELQGVDKVLARQIWQEVLRDAGRGFEMRSWVESHLENGEDQGVQLENVKAQGDDSILTLLRSWNWKGDVSVLAKACGLLKNPDQRSWAFLQCASYTGDAALGKMALDNVKSSLGNTQTQESSRETMLYIEAALSARFESEPAGFAALDRAIAYTIKNHRPGSRVVNRGLDGYARDDIYARQTRTLAHGSPNLVQRLMENIESEPPVGYQAKALSNAIPTLARNFGYETVLPLFDELDKLPETDPKGHEERAINPTKTRAFATAAIPVVKLMGKSPAQALQLARRVTDSYSRTEALAAAARFQSGGEAAKLWTELVQGARSEEAPMLAAWAWKFDPALGEKLFAQVRRNRESADRLPYPDTLGNYAFYYARLNPAQARLLLEKAWGLAAQKKADASTMSSTALAMSAIDGQRALEMARSIPTDQEGNALETRRKIGQYLAMTPEQRSNWSFINWYDTTAFPGESD